MTSRCPLPQEVRRRLAGRRVLLADQSAWAGGMLRWRAACQALGSQVLYAVQDADVPWVQKGRRQVEIVRAWSPYYSLACKYPWSFSVPGARFGNLLDSFDGPRGLHYLIGPSSSDTIYGYRGAASAPYREQLHRMLNDEADWALRLTDMLGLPASPLERLPQRGAHGLTRHFCERLDLAAPLSFVECFGDGRLQATGLFPEHFYWWVMPDGRRHDTPRPGAVQFPKGAILPLEICANSFVLGCTRLGYLDEILQLRDRFAPWLKLSMLSISFDWSWGDVEPLQELLRLFNARKKKRGQSPFRPNGQALAKISRYWRRRPSVVSWMILGGELKPRYEYIEV